MIKEGPMNKKPRYSKRMSPEELQEYLKIKTQSGRTKNGRAYKRHPKHKGRIDY